MKAVVKKLGDQRYQIYDDNITDHTYCCKHKTDTPTWPLSDFFNTNSIYIWFQQ